MDEPRIAPAGDAALLVDLGDVSLDALQAASAAVRRVPGVRAWTVGHRSLLGVFDPSTTTLDGVAAGVREALASMGTPDAIPARSHVIPVSFADADAPDLPLLLDHARLTRDAFLDAVAELRLRARFLGFLRGFAYLEGVPESWRLPRRMTSRARVPAGSLGIAGAMAAFYPAESPGGWNLVGRTAARLWDPARDQPNLIAAGDEVRIVPAPAPDATAAGGLVARVSDPRPAIATVREAGQWTLVVAERDERRREWGLPPGGPFDPAAAAAANRGVGNREGETVLECVLVGPTLVLHDAAVLSWAGAEAAIRVGDRRVDEPRLFEAAAGDVLAIGPLRGIRGVLAIRGGFADPAERFAATPAALRAGDLLRGGGGDVLERARMRAHDRADRGVLRARVGPHPADDPVLDWIAGTRWLVSPAIDRTGIRLHGAGRVPDLPAELPSCGMQFGTVQCHPNGDLVVMGPDHPVTGGYLQPLTVTTTDLWKLGQLAPGDPVDWSLIGG